MQILLVPQQIYANYKYRLFNAFNLCGFAWLLHIWKASFKSLKSNKHKPFVMQNKSPHDVILAWFQKLNYY